MEGAIGYDCRRLEDGRRAYFSHTTLHRRLKRAFFERRDAMFLIHASFISTASMGSNPRLDFKSSYDIVEGSRRSLLKMAFPYLKIEETPNKPENYDAYFDELDAIEEAQKKQLEASSKLAVKG